jgi:hypothetical protein
MRILGLYHPNKSDEFLTEMVKLGFNGYAINPDWNPDPSLSYYENQIEHAKKMRAFYEHLKTLGFKHFLMPAAGWGLADFDQNWFYEIVYNEFKDCGDDILWSIEEFYEDWVETGKMTEEEYNKILTKKKQFFANTNLELGNTARNKIRFNSDSLTSYIRQSKYWRPTDKLNWIFGQLAWHNLIGSLCYKSKSKSCGDVVYLYQGNYSKLDGIGWENAIGDFLGIREKFEAWQRKRFIEKFKEK